MIRICPKCLSVHDSKDSNIKLDLISGPAIVGSSLFIIGTTYDHSDIFFIIGLSMLVIGIITTIYYFKRFNNICSKCNYKKIPTLNELEAQKLLQEKGMSVKDDSTHHCSNCGYGTDGIVQNKIFSIMLIIIGIITFTPNPIAIIGSIIIVGVGIYGVSTNYRKNFRCPNCKNRTLVSIDIQ